MQKAYSTFKIEASISHRYQREEPNEGQGTYFKSCLQLFVLCSLPVQTLPVAVRLISSTVSMEQHLPLRSQLGVEDRWYRHNTHILFCLYIWEVIYYQMVTVQILGQAFCPETCRIDGLVKSDFNTWDTSLVRKANDEYAISWPWTPKTDLRFEADQIIISISCKAFALLHYSKMSCKNATVSEGSQMDVCA